MAFDKMQSLNISNTRLKLTESALTLTAHIRLESHRKREIETERKYAACCFFFYVVHLWQTAHLALTAIVLMLIVWEKMHSAIDNETLNDLGSTNSQRMVLTI